MIGARTAAGVALAAALAGVLVVAASGQRRQRALDAAPLPSADSAGPSGLGAAAAFLSETGRPAVRRAAGDPAPPPGAVVVIAAPRAGLGDGDVAALLAHARGGGTVVVALGAAPQPALSRALGLSAAPAPAPPGGLARGRAAEPLLAGLALPAGPRRLASTRSDARAAAAAGDGVSALSFDAGRGALLVLAGPEPLENAHLGQGDALSFLVRLAARGPVVLDERFLASGGPASRAGRGLLALAGQALLAAAVLVLALGRRLGPVRAPAAEGAGRTSGDYLASLANLYRRAGAEPALAGAAFARERRRVERRAGISPGTDPAEAARRLAARSPGAAAALAAGEAALAGGRRGVLLEVLRSAAEAEAALAGRAGGATSSAPRR
jgi:hypothetical protein